jgi:hypothetical protein
MSGAQIPLIQGIPSPSRTHIVSTPLAVLWVNPFFFERPTIKEFISLRDINAFFTECQTKFGRISNFL